MTATAALLRSNPLFARLGAEDLERLAAVTALRHYPKGSLLFSQGAPPEQLFTIAQGRVKVVKLLTGGKELILEILGVGAPVGAVAAYEASPYPASAVALEDSACLVVSRKALFALLESCPSLVRGLLGGLSLRIAQLSARMTEVAGSKVETRLALLFLKLATVLGHDGGEGLRVTLVLSRQELASLTGTTLETCIRVMSRWSRDGWVRTERDGFTILNRRALEDLTQT
jgi:CRP/FNR family transcriptional regulator